MGCGTSRSPAVLNSSHRPQSQPAPYNKLQENSEETNCLITSNNNETLPEFTATDLETALDDLVLSFEKAAALRLNSPEQMWAAVKKTCSPNQKWVIEKNKSRRGWKTIRLFVSSTFKDFHAEREVLVKEVYRIILFLPILLNSDWWKIQ